MSIVYVCTIQYKKLGGFYIVVDSGDVQNMSTLEQNI
jgi:hypothetical protein